MGGRAHPRPWPGLLGLALGMGACSSSAGGTGRTTDAPQAAPVVSVAVDVPIRDAIGNDLERATREYVETQLAQAGVVRGKGPGIKTRVSLRPVADGLGYRITVQREESGKIKLADLACQRCTEVQAIEAASERLIALIQTPAKAATRPLAEQQPATHSLTAPAGTQPKPPCDFILRSIESAQEHDLHRIVLERVSQSDGCWPSANDRTAVELRSLLELGRFDACVTAAGRYNGPLPDDLRNIKKMCQLRLEGEGGKAVEATGASNQ